MNKRVYPYEPDVAGYLKSAGFFSWQTECKQTLSEILGDMVFHNVTQKPRITRFRSGDTGVVQVWDRNWKLHVQCVLQGSKEKRFYEKNGINPEDIVVSLDIEADSTDRKLEKIGFVHLDAVMLNQLRTVVLNEISTIAASELGEARVEEKPTEHLVWENMTFSPDSPEDINQVAHRMKVYAERLLPVAMAAMDSWAIENGFDVG